MATLFKRLERIQNPDPGLTAESWFTAQPCRKITLGSRVIILTQPSSSALVYMLGIMSLIIGIYFIQIRGAEMSRLFWGISLVLWGIGAILAGTSYQAFGYQIKCAGREAVCWTSWWEVIYLIFQQSSISALLAAVACSCTEGLLRSVLLGYAVLSAVIYAVLILIGGLVPIKRLITFEFMVLVSAPSFLLFLLLNSWRFYHLGNPMDLVLLLTWISLCLVMLAYWIYEKLGLTEKFWRRGIWFSENDVLHIGLILWMIYIANSVTGSIYDYTAPVLQ